MPELIDLTGRRFGRLTVIARVGKKWLCACDCGNHKLFRSGNLRSGRSKSCACIRNEILSSVMSTHGLSKRTEYIVWKSMRDRCNNPKNINYHRYGGRGIKVAPEWEDFSVFLNDMGPRPTPSHSIERVNNDEGYHRDNCIWALEEVQQNNRITNRIVKYQGERITLMQASKRSGIPYSCLKNRVKRNVPAAELFTAKQTARMIEYNGQMMTIREASEASGIGYRCLLWRVRNNVPPDKLFSPEKISFR